MDNRPTTHGTGSGPLAGVRVVELAGFGPGPIGCMLLSDMGAEVIRVERPETRAIPGDVVLRGRRSVILDLKSDEGKRVLWQLIADRDVLVESFRPGVLERLGFPPDECWRRNERLVIARVTGWGQTGPMSMRAGHDVNYAAKVGVLHAIGERGGPPVIPLNIAADGTGGWMLGFGVVCALLEARNSGRGQVIDVAMIDAAATSISKWFGELASGSWHDERGVNRADGGAHYYHVYKTADDRFLSVGAMETQFYREFMTLIGCDPESIPEQHDRAQWPQLIAWVADRIRARTLDEWVAVFDGHDACTAPVLGLVEATTDVHATARNAFVTIDGIPQPAPAPRFSRTPGAPGSIPAPGRDTDTVLAELAASPCYLNHTSK